MKTFKYDMRVSEVVQPYDFKIFLDMDGVLADFFGEWAKLDGVDHYKDIDNPEAKLQLVRDHPTFWVDIPLLPNAKRLIKTTVELFGEYYICSSPLEGDPRSAPGKRRWLRNNLSDMPPAGIVFTNDKAQYAKNPQGKPNVLVDDWGKNIKAWDAAGGIAIHYEDYNFDNARKQLTKIAGGEF